ncbi:hypothetical protein [Butyrivibrio sp. INlla14]|uniref:hypothetical protein n=1 Tax=Butyrivibrio sp. INlla14 TaxID=1520808 RepID=UPI00087603FD|nr:hypothetical protein [Butyrivibrio sp. INlla14]SCX96715.1 hypothetical protein SAMN02910371_00566 [Butyrivibrio sp. INlla14]
MSMAFENSFDIELNREMRNAVSDIYPSDLCKAKIFKEINGGSINNKNIRKIPVTRVAAIAVACLCLMSISAYAGGLITGKVSGHLSNHNYSEYKDMDKVIDKVGYDFWIPESFDNGYQFEGYSTGFTADIDDDGNKYNEKGTVVVDYINGEQPMISLYIEPVESDGDYISDTEAREIEGITVHYNLDTYLEVTEDYKIPKEELDRAETDPHFFISDGADEVKYSEVAAISFDMNDVNYCMIANSNEFLTANNMFDMAEEIINNQ